MEDIKSLPIEELEHRIEEKKKALIDLRIQKVSQQLKDYSQISKTKADIARLKTAITLLNKKGE
jgi:large subunit ribosomal protein L29